MSFKGKVAVVAGGGGGIGLNIARDLAAAGARVTAIDVKDPPGAMPGGPGTAAYVRADLTDEAATRVAIQGAHAAGGRLDYLVNTVGVLWFGRDRSVLDIDLGDWDRVLNINLKSMVHTVRAAVPLMRRSGGGAMVHFSSIQCLRGDADPQDAYQASKAAVVALSKSLAIQFAPDGIRSNTILPGGTVSPMQARWDGDAEAQAAVAAVVPLGRIGTTQDQADACLFLLSEKAAYITGTELVVDGGVTALP
jgi:NAD(P)-dependent dehydrogenase (short-subunit alcohol dehydrogenase family)